MDGEGAKVLRCGDNNGRAGRTGIETQTQKLGIEWKRIRRGEKYECKCVNAR